jgi:hypothetical protein
MKSVRRAVTVRIGYFLYLAAVVFVAAFLSARVAHAQSTCKYIDCWADGYPTPPCGDCGTYAEWISFNKTTDCISCAAGKCHVYETYYNYYYYSYDCFECRNWTFIQQCLTCC